MELSNITYPANASVKLTDATLEIRYLGATTATTAPPTGTSDVTTRNTLDYGKIKIDYTATNLGELELVKLEDGITIDGEFEAKVTGAEGKFGLDEYHWKIKSDHYLKAVRTLRIVSKIQVRMQMEVFRI